MRAQAVALFAAWSTYQGQVWAFPVLNSSLTSCQSVAGSFLNTCTGSTAYANVSLIEGVTQTCTGEVTCTNSSGDSTSCTWSRKLCVTCATTSNVVYMRIQSNGLPDHCYGGRSAPEEQNIDYTIKWNPNVTGIVYQSPASQTALDTLLCSSTSISLPATSSVTATGTADMNTVSGTALSGISHLTALSADKVDPFYPSSGSAEGLDSCLGHPDPGGAMYHYHAIGPCVFQDTCSSTCQSCNQAGSACNMTNLIASAMSQTAYKKGTVVGIAKDGHVIFGPYDDSGSVVTGLDVCNGKFIDTDGDGVSESYAYFATTRFPYLVGCFGPGSNPGYIPSCTTNGHLSYPTPTYDLYTSATNYNSSSTSTTVAPTPAPTRAPTKAPTTKSPTTAPTAAPSSSSAPSTPTVKPTTGTTGAPTRSASAGMPSRGGVTSWGLGVGFIAIFLGIRAQL